MELSDVIKPREYTSDARGDLARIRHAVYAALARYGARDNAPAWLRMVDGVLDFQEALLDRPHLSYKPVERAVKSWLRNGGF